MIRSAYLILIIISLMMGSCSDKKQKLDRHNLIPEKELVSLLTDVHLADGLLSLPKINFWVSSLDSVSPYNQVIEKHGYTKEILDRTMKYYFLNNPKKLSKIYDQVLGKLSEMESRVEKESKIEITGNLNQWKGKDFYSISGLSNNDTAIFDIILYKPGFYTLTFSATLFPDDQSVNPGVIAYTCSQDSIETGKRQYIKTIDYLKDGQPHIYKLIFNLPENRIRHLRGWFYDFNNCPYGSEKHIKIDNISLTYSSAMI